MLIDAPIQPARQIQEKPQMRIRSFLAVAALCVVPLAAPAQEASSEGFTAAMDKMMADMHMELTGDADRDFAMMMIPHHQSAIDMAVVEFEHGDDPQLRALAEKIIEAQEAEICRTDGMAEE